MSEKHEAKQKPPLPAGYLNPYGEVPEGFKPDPLVIPGFETDPTGVMSLSAPKHEKGWQGSLTARGAT